MTLCIAWIRQEKENQELVFATDSCLGGGERWENGVKLFELPRKDCLICFSGYTVRTYPMILNLINLIKFDKHAANPNFDVNDLMNYMTTLFTDIIKSIKLDGTKTYEDVLKEDPVFDFIFGGWSWKENKFKLWRIEYSYEAHGFVPKTDYDNLVFTMVGDELDEATKRLEDEIKSSGRILKGNLDMEPLKVLVQIIREPKYDSISGALQVAKIYPPGQTEFFGVYYPSAVNGKRTFLGRDVSQTNNPAVRFIDPDTGSITELEVPQSLKSMEMEAFGADREFVAYCYPQNSLKDGLTEREKELLKSILKENSYKWFLQELEAEEVTVNQLEDGQ
jgi:hypothetical protein